MHRESRSLGLPLVGSQFPEAGTVEEVSIMRLVLMEIQYPGAGTVGYQLAWIRHSLNSSDA